MGISLNPLFYLLNHRHVLENCLVLGRQQVNLPERQRDIVDFLFNKFEVDYNYDALVRFKYADELLLKLGADSITWLDFSDYEGATFIHDMNVPISVEAQKFDSVVDGGTLEHVFNIPVAFKNMYDLLRADGSYLGLSPGNNFFGHGFYQFSPELFWTGLASSGFEVRDVSVMLRDESLSITHVPNPRLSGKRLEIKVSAPIPVDIFCFATRALSGSTGSLLAQQSDYVTAWSR